MAGRWMAVHGLHVLVTSPNVELCGVVSANRRDSRCRGTEASPCKNHSGRVFAHARKTLNFFASFFSFFCLQLVWGFVSFCFSYMCFKNASLTGGVGVGEQTR